MRLILEINPENLSKDVTDSFHIRKAARAVLFDSEGKVALLHVKKHGYHKLPGGGIEKGESIKNALTRECLEKTGCNIKIEQKIGSIIEYRGQLHLKQISECFIATVEGDKGTPSFTKEEEKDQFELIWVNFDEVKGLLEADLPTDYEGKFIKVRDRIFIREAMKLLIPGRGQMDRQSRIKKHAPHSAQPESKLYKYC
ncbi:MAG: NUDIX domain-containing protein [bacterium]|nr:NUDIX domain-containing protein [bacterium]